MNKIHYWLMDKANTYPYFMALIHYDVTDHSDIPTVIASIRSHLTTEVITDIFRDLFSNNYLLGIKSSDLEEIELGYINSPNKPPLEELILKGFRPSDREIKNALNREQKEGDELYYFLTSKGGCLWESIFKPKWNQYLQRRTSYDNRFSLIYCADLNIGEKLLLVDDLRELDRNDNDIIQSIPETKKWESFSPWQVVYWKVLPVGYVISYESERIENTNQAEELLEEIEKAHEWLIDICNWYTGL
jgi:hypothetical protein